MLSTNPVCANGAPRQMYSHILIATDGSELAQRGVDQGLALAEKLGSKVTTLNVTVVFPAYAARGEFSNIAVIQAIEVHQKMGEEFAQTVLAAAAALAAKRNVECESVHVGEKCGQPRRSWRFPKKEVAI